MKRSAGLLPSSPLGRLRLLAAWVTLSISVLATHAAAETTVAPRPWSVHARVGVQALGFTPTPANPQAAVGAELGLVTKGIYQFRFASELGGFYQDKFSSGATFDTPLVNRFTTPWGVYADLDALLGGGVSWINIPTYRRGDDGQYERSAPPLHPHVRLGLGAALGFDLSRVSSSPVRIFMSYRQLVLTPFMPKNDVPLMGLAALSLGVSVEMNR